ncbi:MAG: sigma-54-dependent transcriptional regulator, partial [Desulfurivibrionaceae bacterium]
MVDAGRLLIIDDEESMLQMLSVVTSKGGYAVTLARNGEEGLAALAKGPFDLILCDLKMPRLNGQEFLKKAKEVGVEAPIVMMSAYAAIEDAVAAIKAGAYDFITKPFKADEVLLTLERAGEHLRLQRENQRLRQQIDDLQREQGLDGMVGKSSVMVSFLKTVAKVAQYDTTALITGESGTGK